MGTVTHATWGSLATAPTSSFIVVGGDGGVDKRISIGTILGKGYSTGNKEIVGSAGAGNYLILRSNESSGKPIVSRLDGDDVPNGTLVTGTVHAFVNNTLSTSDAYIYCEAGTSGEGGLYVGNSATADQGRLTYDVASDFWSILTAGTERARITSSGMRIGATGSPAQRFEFMGTAAFNALFQNTGGTGTVSLQMQNTAGAWASRVQTTGAFAIVDVSNSKFPLSLASNAPTNTIYGDASGNVILGGATAAASAAGALHLNNATKPTAALTDGVVLYSRDTQAGQADLYAYPENSGASGEKQITGTLSRLNANFAKTSDTTLGTCMSIYLGVGRYLVKVWAHLSPDVTGGAKWTFVGTSGLATTNLRYDSILIDHATNAIVYTLTSNSFAIESYVGTQNATLTMEGCMLITTAGLLNFRFAQSVSSAGASTVLRNSYMRIEQVDFDV